jgi:hypothetical protein
MNILEDEFPFLKANSSIVLTIYILFPLLLAILFFVTIRQAIPYHQMISKGLVEVVEGEVHLLKIEGAGRREFEQIRIEEEYFRFKSGIVRPGYRRGTESGGVLTDGKLVRVTFVDNIILRIEEL